MYPRFGPHKGANPALRGPFGCYGDDMTFPPSPECALARWLAHGITSRTHPVLDCALQTFFHPLGVEARSLEAEPFSALESGQGEWWLNKPQWNPARFDRRNRASPDFAYLLEHPGQFVVAVDDRGIISPALNPSAADDPEARSFLDAGEDGWRAVRHTLQAAQDAETFLYAAAGLILANDPVAEVYALGDDDAFCAAVLGRLREIRGA